MAHELLSFEIKLKKNNSLGKILVLMMLIHAAIVSGISDFLSLQGPKIIKAN